MIGQAVKKAQTRGRTLRWKALGRTRQPADGDALRILFYHRVADDPRDPLAVSCDNFEAQMATLHAEGYKVVDVVTGLDLLYRGELQAGTVALTFDDGYVDNAIHALPVLEQLGFRATVFVVTDFAARRAVFSPGHGSPAPVMRWEEIRELDGSSALTFEPHTVTHPDLTRVTDRMSWTEIATSRTALETALGREASAFAYPGGFFGARELVYVARAGFRYGITCEPGLTRVDTDHYLVRRTQIDPGDRLDDFTAKLEGSHDSPLMGRGLYRRLKYGAGDPLKAALGAAALAIDVPPDGPVEDATMIDTDADGSARPIESSLARGSAVLFATQVAANLGFFIAVLLLAHGLSPAGRGTIAFVTLSMLVISKLARLGLPEATSVFTAKTPRRCPTLVTNLGLSAVGLGAGLAWLFVLVLLATGARPAGITVEDLIVIGLFTPVASLVDSLVGFLVGAGHPRSGGLMNVVQPWFYAIGLTILATQSTMEPTNVAVLWGLGMLVAAILLVIVVQRLRGFGRPSLGALREAVRFGVRAWVGSTLRFLNFRSDQIVMGFIATEAALGFYAVAVNASEVLLLLPQATGLALLPLIARADPTQHRDRTLRAFRVLMVITLPAVALAMLLGPVVIPFLFGAQYEDSVTPFLLLAPGAVGFTAIAVFSSAALGGELPLRSSVGAAVAFVSGLVFVFTFVPRFEAEGAAIAATLAFTAGGVAQVLAYRGHAHFPVRSLVPGPRDAAECAAGLRRVFTALVGGRRAG